MGVVEFVESLNGTARVAVAAEISSVSDETRRNWVTAGNVFPACSEPRGCYHRQDELDSFLQRIMQCAALRECPVR